MYVFTDGYVSNLRSSANLLTHVNDKIHIYQTIATWNDYLYC